MYGDLQGLIGTSLQPIPVLEFPETALLEEEVGFAMAAEVEE